MPEDPQPVRFYKKSEETRIEATVPDGLLGDASPGMASRNPVLMARHSAGFAAAMTLVMVGRMLLFDRAGSEVEAFSALMVLLFWMLFWALLFSAGLAWAREQRLPSFWWPFVAGAATSLGFYAFKALLGHLYGADPAAGESAGAKSFVAAWMAGYSFVAPVLAGVLTALAWRAGRTTHSVAGNNQG